MYFRFKLIGALRVEKQAQIYSKISYVVFEPYHVSMKGVFMHQSMYLLVLFENFHW